MTTDRQGARAAGGAGGCLPPAASPLPPRIFAPRRSGGRPDEDGRLGRQAIKGGAGMRPRLPSTRVGSGRIAGFGRGE